METRTASIQRFTDVIQLPESNSAKGQQFQSSYTPRSSFFSDSIDRLGYATRFFSYHVEDMLRPWTQYDKRLLVDLLSKQDKCDSSAIDWNAISKALKRRRAIECFLEHNNAANKESHSVPWTREEDIMIIKLAEELNYHNFGAIAASLSGSTSTYRSPIEVLRRYQVGVMPINLSSIFDGL